MKTILRALLLFAALAGTAMAAPKVAVMPSFTQRTTYGKATMNSSITIWGRAWNLSTTTTPTFTIDFGDGTSTSSANVSVAGNDHTRADYISVSHTFTTAGSKTITLKVTDSTGSTSQQAVVRVLPTPVAHTDQVDMAIEKGLLYLYANVTQASATNWYWNTQWGSGSEIGEGVTAFCALAFEENGHSPFNDPVQDAYQYLLSCVHTHMLAQGTLQNVPAHDDGSGNVRVSDSNGNGKGAYFLGLTYSDCARAMALMNPFTNAAQAQTTYLPVGSALYNANGVYDTTHPYSYFDLITDFIDTLSWSQGDGPSFLGAYGYNINQQQQSRFDGSAQQWPALVTIMSKDVLGISAPAWWQSNNIKGLEHLMDADGGVEYATPNSNQENVGKTGGGLTILKAGGLDSTSTDGVNLLKYLGVHWDEVGYAQVTAGGWAGYWYGMYGVKKGLALQGLQTVKVGTTTRDWYGEMSGWLLGDSTLVASTLAPSIRSNGNLFGQFADGHWSSGNTWVGSTVAADTAVSILTLTTSVTSPPPVPVIAVIPVQSDTGPFSVTLDATGSYSTDPSREIVEYLWDLDSSDGLNWTTPDATGPTPTISPAYLHTVGTHTITLRVKDNSNPAQVATISTTITVQTGDVPPVAVAVASSSFQGYNGLPGASIVLDGSQSYDINGDAITQYSWDLDGDGVFGDAFGSTLTFTKATTYTGVIGLKVTANGATSLPVYVDVQVSSTNLSLGTVVASNVNGTTSATFAIPVSNDVTSGLTFSNVPLRLYNGDPLHGGVPIADASASTTVSLGVGETKTVTMTNVQLGGAGVVYAYIDPLNTIPESNKNDNVAFCLGILPQTITFGALPTQTLSSPDFTLTATASSGLTVSYTSSNTSVATIVNGNQVHIVGSGTTTITASQAGNATYQAASNVNQLLSVSRYTQVINFPALPTVSSSSPDFDPGATSNDPNSVLTYTSANTSVATIVNGKIHPIAVGTSVITANFAADSNFLAGSATQTLTVIANALQSVTMPANNNYKESDKLTFTANYLLPVTVSGTPYISIKVGSTTYQAVYVSGSGTSQIKFTYVVVSKDFDSDGIDVYSPINLNGGNMTNTGGASAAPLAFTVPNTTGITVGGMIFMTSQVNSGPDTSGTPIDYWDSIRSGMVINTNGAVAFRAYLTLDAPSGVTANNYQGIWKAPLGTSASTVNVVRTGDIAPDCSNAVYDMLTENPYINDNGACQVTFAGVLRVGSGSPAVTAATSMGVWSELGGAGLHKVVRGGDTVAGGMVAGNVNPDGWIVTSDIGTMAFSTGLTNGLSALVRASASGGSFTLSTIAKEGAAAPATGGGTSDAFNSFLGNSTDPRMNRLDGNIAFYSGLASGNAGVFYMPNGGSLSSVVRTGDHTPDGTDTFTGLDRPSLTSDTIYFRAYLATGGQSVWKGNPAVPSSLTLVARTNDTSSSGRITNVPAGAKIWSVWAPFSNVNGKVAFRVTTYDGVSENRAVVADTDGTLKLVAKVGDAAPGTSGTFVNFDHPVIGDNNQIAFLASTSDGVTAIWRQNSNGGALVRIFAVGDLININGTMETIQSIILPGSESSDRLSEWTTIDKNGRVLAHATYLSGKTGVLLSAPSS